MSPETQQRIMEFASEVIARESGKVMSSLQPGYGVDMLGNEISVEPSLRPQVKVRQQPIMFAGRLLVGNGGVQVVPFVVPNKFDPNYVTTLGWVIPRIGGRSIFSSPPPLLPYQPSGGAVYLQLEYNAKAEILQGAAVVTGTVSKAEVVQVRLGSPPPYSPARLAVQTQLSAPINVTMTKAVGKACFLIGVYTRENEVTTGRAIGSEVQDFTDPQDGGRGPHFVGWPTRFPVEVQYSFTT